MQFAFSYNYFVIGERKNKTMDELFTDLDTDNSGSLSSYLFNNNLIITIIYYFLYYNFNFNILFIFTLL